MIPPLPGWSFNRAGDRVVLRPQEAPDDCTITYVERVRPLVAPAAAASALSWPAGAEVEAPSPPRPLVTVEGEHAALVVVHGRAGALAVKRVVGVVLVDDYYSCIVGGTHVPARFAELEALVERLTVEDRHFLGERRRSFAHRAPAGWRAATDGWYQVRYRSPDEATTLIVYPALPHLGDPDAAERVLATHLEAPDAALAADEPTPFMAASGLSGQAWSLAGRLDGEDVTCALVVLRDRRYVYPVAAIGPADQADASCAALLALAASVQPIPDRNVTPARAATFFQFWTE